MDNDKYVPHRELNHVEDNLPNKIDLSTERMLHEMDKRFYETDKKFYDMQYQIDKRFNETNKKFNDLLLQINDVKNTANNNKEKINWLLYTVVGGIALSIIATIISNLLTR